MSPLIVEILAAIIKIGSIQLSEAEDILEPLFSKLCEDNFHGMNIDDEGNYSAGYSLMIDLLKNKLAKEAKEDLLNEIDEAHKLIQSCLADFSAKKPYPIIMEIEVNLGKLGDKLGELQKLI